MHKWSCLIIKIFLTKYPLVNKQNTYGKKPIDLNTIPEMKNILGDYISKNENILKKAKRFLTMVYMNYI